MVDGSEQIRLTSPAFEAHQPHWSADGSKIALIARTGAERWRIFTVNPNGSGFAPLTAVSQDAEDQGVPTWSKDGRFIVYGDWLYSRAEAMEIRLFDRQTTRTAVLEGSDNLWTPRWSPDGKYISALRPDWSGLMLTEPGSSSRWREIVRGQALDNSVWSMDSKYIYLTGSVNPNRLDVLRVSIPGGVVEEIADIGDFPSPTERWFGVAPDGSPLGIRSVPHREIYYLESTLR
jgi:Tol biopolymer transport system component